MDSGPSCTAKGSSDIPFPSVDGVGDAEALNFLH